jgi:hypothetical protein
LVKVEEAEAKSQLPAEPDYKWIDTLVASVYEDVIKTRLLKEGETCDPRC